MRFRRLAHAVLLSSALTTVAVLTYVVSYVMTGDPTRWITFVVTTSLLTTGLAIALARALARTVVLPPTRPTVGGPHTPGWLADQNARATDAVNRLRAKEGRRAS